MITRAVAALFLIAVSGCGADLDDEDNGAGDNLSGEHDDAEVEGTPRARVCADGATTKGIDVSKWQGTIDWGKVKTAGYAYAFIRVSDGANTWLPAVR